LTPEEYQAFTRQLQTNLEHDQRVLALVALGSMARQSHLPDRWSDHDFFLIVESGRQDNYRHNLDWLPNTGQIVFAFQETEHGMKVIYENAHLIEFAVFDQNELRLAKVNDYQVLLDRADVAKSLSRILSTTPESKGDTYYFGQLLSHILVGVARCVRGEKISGAVFIKHYAVDDVLRLLAKHEEAPDKVLLDSLDPLRRFETVFPELGVEINRILMQEPVLAAGELLNLIERQYQGRIPDYPAAAIATVRHYLADVDVSAKNFRRKLTGAKN
jgi:hypothetical protein